MANLIYKTKILKKKLINNLKRNTVGNELVKEKRKINVPVTDLIEGE